MERVARDLAETSPFPLAHDAAVVQMDAARGEIELAGERFRRLMRAAGTLAHDPLYCWTLALLAEDAVLLEDADAATVLYDALLPLAGRFVVGAGAVTCLGSTSHFLGRLAALLGKPDEARAHLETAVAAHRTAGCVALLAASESALTELSSVAVVLESVGPVVTARYGAEVARLPRSLGLAYLTILVANPCKDVPAARLVALATNGSNGVVGPEVSFPGLPMRYSTTPRSRRTAPALPVSTPNSTKPVTGTMAVEPIVWRASDSSCSPSCRVHSAWAVGRGGSPTRRSAPGSTSPGRSGPLSASSGRRHPTSPHISTPR